MSLTRQAALLLVGALCLAVLGSLGLHARALQRSLQQQLEVRNQDGATLLAIALSQQGGDPALVRTVAAASFDLGHYRRLRLRGEDGHLWFDLRAPERLAQAPRWLVRALPVEAEPGGAQVTDGWRPLGRLEVSAHSAWAHDALWSALQHAALLLTLLASLTVAAAMRALRAWQRPLDATVAQARALEDGRFEIADEPRTPELRRLTRSMNSMVRRMQAWFDAQAAQLAQLQRQARTDAVTGLPNRCEVLGRLACWRENGQAGVGALLLLRVLDLQGLNERLGRAAADEVLRSVAAVLQHPRHAQDGAVAGRLNGSDFVLALPASGGARAAAAALVQSLRAGGCGSGVVVGAVEGADGLPLPALLASADAALARAEAAGPFAVEVLGGAAEPAVLAGARAWRVGLEHGLDAGLARLGEQPVRDPEGRLLHLRCRLWLPLAPDADPVAPAQWRPLAARSGLLPRADLALVGLALRAIGRDGVPRSVKLSGPSLAGPGFGDAVQATLQQHAEQATRLLLELAEPTTETQLRALRESATLWRASGVRMGIEDVGGVWPARAWLPSIALHQLRVGGGTLAGVATDPVLQQYARSLLALAHGMGWQLVAADVDHADDLAALWDLGFDGASGPALAATQALA